MLFARIPITEASGAILAHSIKLPDQRLKKGQRLDSKMLNALEAAGILDITVARLEADDISEDEAAGRLALAIAGPNVRVAKAFTGRCNLYAETDGLMVLQVATLEAINRVHEALTVATLANTTRVSAGQMLATIKIIPYASPAHALDECLGLAQQTEAPMQIHPFEGQRVAMIQTRVSDGREALLDKMHVAIENRLMGLGSQLEFEERCPHDKTAIATLVKILLARNIDMLMIAGASAIVDRGDVIPAAIEAAGGEVLHFGMPVDPGNLLLLARHGNTPIIGLPSCARSPSYNGLDQVLERLAANLEVNAHELMGLGVGGLLKEIRERPQAREALPAPDNRPHISAVLLAAGMSRRMGTVNKLLASVQGQPMVCRVADRLLATRVDEVIVVTGHESEKVQEVLADRPVKFVHNADYASGLSSSLAAGVNALTAKTQAALICLADMPELESEQMNQLLDAYDPPSGALICVPTFNGKRGNPVLWDQVYFSDMSEIQGDVGARHLIGQHTQSVVEVPMQNSGVVFDVDSPQVLAQLIAESK